MSSETNFPKAEYKSRDASDYANELLGSLECVKKVDQLSDHPAIAYRRSGLLQTTGLMAPTPLAAHAQGALMALKAISDAPEKLPQHGAVVLGERARLRDTIRKGRFCAGGYGRLLDCADGRIALNLVREDDWVLIPAWLEDYVEDWDGITKKVTVLNADYMVERAAEIGLAVSKEELPDRPKSWYTSTSFEKSDPKNNPLIVDLSGLWAGPLASSLLMGLGARVVKVEGPERPDGMRLGHAGFYQLINTDKLCAAFDFKTEAGLSGLKDLLSKADIVIEASRPRAFEQLGIRAEEFVAGKPGKIWARLTAYGRDQNRVGFGDDIGISAGLSRLMDQAHSEPCFVGDAIADPVNGLHLALAIWAHYQKGGGAVIDLSMQDVLRFAMGDIEDPKKTAEAWSKMVAGDTAPLYPMRPITGRVHEVGEDNGFVSSIVRHGN